MKERTSWIISSRGWKNDLPLRTQGQMSQYAATKHKFSCSRDIRIAAFSWKSYDSGVLEFLMPYLWALFTSTMCTWDHSKKRTVFWQYNKVQFKTTLLLYPGARSAAACAPRPHLLSLNSILPPPSFHFIPTRQRYYKLYFLIFKFA
jgi:hypothetical protein